MKPQSEAELSDLLRSATEPLRIRGGGTRSIGRPVASAVLETSGLTGITLYEPGALTLVAQAGTPLAEVTATLAAEGQHLPFEVPDLRGLMGVTGQSTIGGVVAANASGPRRVQVGACRDSLIGVRFVDGQGTVVKNGGRVMKNVTGYDLVKLMAGSHGTLGVLTEVAFKLLPATGAVASLRLQGLEDGRAIAAMSAALGSPFEVSGAAHWPGEGTFLRIEGFAQSVAYRTGRLAQVLAPFGAVETETDAAACHRWAAIRDVAPFHGQPGEVWALSVRPSMAADLVARSGALARLYDWGGGRVWLLMPEGHDLRVRLGAHDGHATLMRASAETRGTLASFPPEAAPLAALTAGLRARFDPRGILNPGLTA